MSRDGNGNYVLPVGNPVVTGTNISSTDFNATMADVRDALTQSLSRDGQTTPTANLAMGGNRHTGVSDATLANQYASAKQVQNGSLCKAGSVSNVVDAYAASIIPAIASYTDGQEITVTPTATNTTGAPTLSLNGLGAKSIQKEANVACAAGDIVVNVPAFLLYVAQGAGYFLLLNPQVITGARVGAIPDGSLSTNVALRSASNTFTNTNLITVGSTSIALQVQTAGSNYALKIAGGTTAGQSLGMYLAGGTNSTDAALQVSNAANTISYFQIRGDGLTICFQGLNVGGSIQGNSNFFALGSTARFICNVNSGSADSYTQYLNSAGNQGFIGLAGAANGLIVGAAVGDMGIVTTGKGIGFSTDGGGTSRAFIPAGAGLQVGDSGGTSEAGFRDIPPVAFTGTHVLVLTDRGKGLSAIGGATSVTIPANSSVAFPVGTAILIDNISGTSITITINTDSLSQVGTAATGTRTLANAGQATLWKNGTTSWRISGVSLT